MCLFLCIFLPILYFPFRKVFFSEIFFKFPVSPSECAWCEKVELRHVHEWNGTKQSAHSGRIYVRAPTLADAPRARQQQKQKAREKRNNTKRCIRFSPSTVGETFGYVRLRLWKNAFYKYRASVHSRGRQSLYSLSLLFFHFFFLLFSSPLYRIKWWIFACPCRLFQKHSGVGFEAAASALVLGYYYFLVFLAFVAPKKKIIYTESTTTTTMANGLWLWLCVECRLWVSSIYTHLILSEKKWKKKWIKWNCYVSTISGYYFYNTNFSSSHFVSLFSFNFSGSPQYTIEKRWCAHQELEIDAAIQEKSPSWVENSFRSGTQLRQTMGKRCKRQ